MKLAWMLPVLVRAVPLNNCFRSNAGSLDPASTTQCAPGSLGLTSIDPAVSESSILLNGNLTTSTRLRMDLWVAFASSSSNQNAVLLTIPSTAHPTTTTSLCDLEGFDVQLRQRHGQLELYYRTNELFVEPCQRLVVGALPSAALAHIALAVGSGQQQVWINGQQSSASRSMASLLNARLELGGVETLYQVGLYDDDEPLDDATVQGLLQQGLPSSPPYVVNTTIHVREDGQVEDQDALWYRTPPTMDEAVHVPLPWMSLDRQVSELMQSLNRTWNDTSSPPTQPYVRTGPSRGQWNDVNGTLVYLPPYNEYAIDRPLDLVEFCLPDSNCAWLEIWVDPVNDPPIPYAVPPLLVRESTQVRMLWGEDVDSNVHHLKIVEPPLYGDLTLWVGSFREDGLLHGTSLASIGWHVNGTEPVYVQYQWKPEFAVGNASLSDSFVFQLADEEGKWSAWEAVNVTIVSALTAVPDPELSILEDEAGSVRITVKDESGLDRRTAILIDSLPTIGLLRDRETGESLSVGAVVAMESNGTLSRLVYRPPPDFCNSHLSSTQNVSFAFRVAALSASNEITSISEPENQTISVECQIDWLHIEVPDITPEILEFSLVRSGFDPCRGSLLNATELADDQCKATAILPSISVDSTDVHDELVQVTVFPGSGYLSFNPTFWNHTRAIEGRRGLTKEKVTFEALPRDLEGILADLRYQSFVVGVNPIDIVLLYGACEGVPVSPEVDDLRTRDCQRIHRTLYVNVQYDPTAHAPSTRLVSGFPWQIFFCVLGFPLLYMGYMKLEEVIFLRVDDDAADFPLWIEHQTDEGDYYYEDTRTGETTWMAPIGESFLPYVEELETVDEPDVKLGSDEHC